jgi:transcriptional repressor of cell division inhibition gene dicB
MKTSDAIQFYKSKSLVAKALGISKAAVSLWGDEVPKLRAYELERLTDGALKVDSPNSEEPLKQSA